MSGITSQLASCWRPEYRAVVKFAILHLSDLHRDLSDELGNAPLLESLFRDIEFAYYHGDPKIPWPALCVISGDLVSGARPGLVDYAAELARQYRQATELLVGIADRFFSGDRGRIVIVPGNHDVSYNHVLESLEKIEVPTSKPERSKLGAELFKRHSIFRWSWDEMCFYKVANKGRYFERIAPFAAAYSEFYRGQRTYPLSPHEQFSIFDYSDLNFTIVGLNSCDENDPLRRIAAIHPDVLAAALRELRNPKYSGRLIAATWHHNVFGGPFQNDFLDSEMLLHLIDAGVSIGFHGHQHRAQCVEDRHDIGESKRKLVVIGAATLCAGPRQLNPGNPRGYNIVEVDNSTWTCRVHQRRMLNSDFGYPIWGPGHFTETNRAFVEIGLSCPASPRPPGLDASMELGEAERLLGLRRWDETIKLLKDAPKDSVARPMLSQALQELGQPKKTIEVLWPPENLREAILLGDALLQDRNEEKAGAFFRLESVTTSDDASLKEILRRLRQKYSL